MGTKVKTKRPYRSSRGEIRRWREKYLKAESVNPALDDFDIQNEHPLIFKQLSIITWRAKLIMQSLPIDGRFERLQRFLAVQIPDSYYLPEGKKANYEMQLSGNSGSVYINVDSLSDISFSSIWEEFEFNAMYIEHTKKNRWPKKELRETIELIDADIDFDGYESGNEYEVNGNVLEVEYDIPDYWD